MGAIDVQMVVMAATLCPKQAEPRGLVEQEIVTGVERVV
jgi:hypothetical protein